MLTHNSYSTLTLLVGADGDLPVYETLLGFARRLIVIAVGVRIDTQLNLHVFNRLLRLPLDYFERHPAGETMYQISQVYRVREFMTGKLLTTFLDMMTLVVLLPFLFYLNATLAWIVLACACLITLVILAFLRPLRMLLHRVIEAETDKQSALGETIFGVKTVKSLALEPQRKALWDERVAEAGKLAAGVRQAGQLAADTGHADRALHVGRRDHDRRLSGDAGQDRLRRGRAVRVHDAVSSGSRSRWSAWRG